MKNEPPYNETWWERELHRNEKLMDRYLAALADNPDLARTQPPEAGQAEHPPDWLDSNDVGVPGSADAVDLESFEEAMLEASTTGADSLEESEELVDNGLENSPPDNEGYAEIARVARQFAVAVASLGPSKEIPEILALSAPKIGANLAGGHGLGYDEETLCGNIVKCRWALADCEFCREMLEQLAERTGRGAFRSLADQSARLSGQIRERITRLRARVWW